jgi:hypothetical protein
MRYRFWALIPLLLLVIVASGCSVLKVSQSPTPTRPPRTPRPTFTPTVARNKGVSLPATATRRPTMTAAAPKVASPTPEEAQASAPITPTVAAQGATLTVANAQLNVRSGPGTNYSIIGQVTEGQQYPITGKNENGDWWQFEYDGQPGWVIGTMVTVSDGAAGVQVAANIPAAPTPRPAAPAAPKPPAQPAQPAQPPAPAQPTYKYAVRESSFLFNDGNWITVRCVLTADRKSGIPGTLRVSGNGVTKEQAFIGILTWANTGMSSSSRYIYSDGCKIEMPLQEGKYTGYLIEGGQQVSDPIEFTVSGTNREWVLAWKPR